MLDGVFGLVATLRRDGVLHRFHFIRKPPGLRLRFEPAAGRGDPAAAIARGLDGLNARRLVRRWTPAAYEPEAYKFGGSSALQATHTLFDTDTRAWWRWDGLHRAGRTSVHPMLLSATVLSDLFQQCVDAPEEVWDVWCRLAALHGDAAAPAGAADAAAPAWCLEDLAVRVNAAEQVVARRYASAHRAFARRLRAIRSRGQLLHGVRPILPHVAITHWNRFGFALPERALMYTAMRQAWSPFPAGMPAPSRTGGDAAL